jgi:hypothetical protein
MLPARPRAAAPRARRVLRTAYVGVRHAGWFDTDRCPDAAIRARADGRREDRGHRIPHKPTAVVLMGEVDVHLSLLQFQFHSLHLPRSFDTQNASIQFMILHSVILAWRRPSQNPWRCLCGSVPFLPWWNGAQRPAAVKGAPLFQARRSVPLTARTALRQSRQEGKGGSFQFCRPL